MPPSNMMDILRILLSPECWPIAFFLLRDPKNFAALLASELAESSQALADVLGKRRDLSRARVAVRTTLARRSVNWSRRRFRLSSTGGGKSSPTRGDDRVLEPRAQRYDGVDRDFGKPHGGTLYAHLSIDRPNRKLPVTAHARL